MSISRDDERPPQDGSSDTFTGEVTVKPLFGPNDTRNTGAGKVTFRPCARSAWHTHPAGQTLIVTEGTGWVQEWGQPKQRIRPGDVIWPAIIGNDAQGSVAEVIVGGPSVGGPGNNNVAIQTAVVGSGGSSVGEDLLFGTGLFGLNTTVVGKDANTVAENIVQGTNLSGSDFAVVGDNALAWATTSSGHLMPRQTGLFGSNFVFAGNNSTNVGNNTATGSSGGFNFVIAGGNNTNVGNNTGGGINIAIELTGVSDVGNCDRTACINIFGFEFL